MDFFLITKTYITASRNTTLYNLKACDIHVLFYLHCKSNARDVNHATFSTLLHLCLKILKENFQNFFSVIQISHTVPMQNNVASTIAMQCTK